MQDVVLSRSRGQEPRTTERPAEAQATADQSINTATAPTRQGKERLHALGEEARQEITKQVTKQDGELGAGITKDVVNGVAQLLNEQNGEDRTVRIPLGFWAAFTKRVAQGNSASYDLFTEQKVKGATAQENNAKSTEEKTAGKRATGEGTEAAPAFARKVEE